MKWICTFLAYSCLLQLSLAQIPLNHPQNIVPNPSFEKYANIPIGWFYKGKHFTNVMRYWSAPTNASPDVFGPKVRVPNQWAEKGFGQQKARTGTSMVGITLYGCEEGKPHCREYLQIQLRESLVIGQNYYLEFWVSHLDRSIQINNIGAHFSNQKYDELTNEVLALSPQINAENILQTKHQKWIKVSGRFTASEEAAYLLIGNFFSDSDTQIQLIDEASLNFAYYYVDDVLLKKEHPIIKVPVADDDLCCISAEVGKLVILKDIYFDTDKAALLPLSFVELNKLIALMEKHPAMVIEIQGHTDNQGNDDYNNILSFERAKAVAIYLNANGIEANRIQFIGYGTSKPIASNDTVDGRQLNRRVAFLILENKASNEGH